MRKSNQLQSFEALIENYTEGLRDLEKSQNKDDLEMEIHMKRVDSLSKKIEVSLRHQQEIIDEIKRTNDSNLGRYVTAAYAG
jgi:hypothetical protein